MGVVDCMHIFEKKTVKNYGSIMKVRHLHHHDAWPNLLTTSSLQEISTSVEATAVLQPLTIRRVRSRKTAFLDKLPREHKMVCIATCLGFCISV